MNTFSTTKSKLLVITGVVTILLLAASFKNNIFRIADNRKGTDAHYRFETFEKGSQELVVRKLTHVERDRSLFQKEFGWYMIDQRDGRLKTYSSQVGAQALILSIPVRLGILNPGQAIGAAELLCAVASAIVLGLIPLWVFRRFGLLAAAVPATLILLSVWLTFYARNVYWVAFTIYAPFVYSLWRYPLLLEGKVASLRFHSVLAGLIAAKALCGYEFISSVILAATVPVVFFSVQQGIPLRGLAARVGTVMAVGALAVIAVFGVHTVQHGTSTGDWRLSSMPYYARALDRGVAGVVNPKTEDGRPGVSAVTIAAQAADEGTGSAAGEEAPKESFLVNLVKRGTTAARRHAMAYLSQPAINFPFTRWFLSFGTVFLLCGGLLAFMIATSRNRNRSPQRRLLYRAMWISCAYAPLCSFSWIVAGLEHFLGHKWLNEIIFFVPMLLWFYVIAGIVFADLLHARERLSSEQPSP